MSVKHTPCACLPGWTHYKRRAESSSQWEESFNGLGAKSLIPWGYYQRYECDRDAVSANLLLLLAFLLLFLLLQDPQVRAK